MKLLRLTITVIASLCLQSAFAGGEGWTHDFEAAKKKAAAENKDLLLDFTGSDWCAPCGMLEKELFSQAAFKTSAMEKFVLVELDFPQDKSKMMAETVKQNNDLQAKYFPSGYPTVILCSADGKPYAANSGYVDGGPEKFLELLDSLRGNKAKMEEGFAAAAKLDGKAKAQAIIDVLKGSGIPAGTFNSFYKEQMDQVKAADPNDEIGFLKRRALRRSSTRCKASCHHCRRWVRCCRQIPLRPQASGGTGAASFPADGCEYRIPPLVSQVSVGGG